MKKIKFIFTLLLIITLFPTMSFAASIGHSLHSPESGWQRIDDSDMNIKYIGSWKLFNNGSHAFYKGAIKYVDKSTDFDTIKFRLDGTKFRIIAQPHSTRSSRIQVKLDGIVIGNYTIQGDSNLDQTLLFEKTGIEKGIHDIELTNLNPSGTFIFDAIDIGQGESLLPLEDETTTGVVLNIEPDKTKIKTTEKVVANLTIDNIKEIAAEDIRVKYDSTKLKYDGVTEVDGFKLVKNDEKAGELRFIVASKGNANIVSSKKTLLQLGFTGIAPGEAKVDIIKGRVSDGIEMEKDLTDEQCGEATILIEQGTMLDVNNSGAFTLLDLAIDARHLNKDPKAEELKKYNTDIVLDNAINDNDLSEIGRLMLENPEYKF